MVTMKRMRGLVALTLSAVVASAIVADARRADACTTFFADTAKGPVVAKSFDWDTDSGYLVVNERGRVHTKLIPGGASETATWVTKHGSLSFSTVGPGFPSSGMNDAGLAIEALVDLGVVASRAPDPARLTGLELVQYGLDTFTTVDEFANYAERAGVSQLAIPLHFFACDAQKACVVVESQSDGAKVRVTRGRALTIKALANKPWSAHGKEPRFRAVATGIVAAPPRDEAEAFGLLDGVAVPRTAWQIVWNQGEKSVQWRAPQRGKAVSQIRFDAVDMTCHGAVRVRGVGGYEGSTPAFTAWTAADASRTATAVVAQVGVDSPATRMLGRAVANATRATHCEASP